MRTDVTAPGPRSMDHDPTGVAIWTRGVCRRFGLHAVLLDLPWVKAVPLPGSKGNGKTTLLRTRGPLTFQDGVASIGEAPIGEAGSRTRTALSAGDGYLYEDRRPRRTWPSPDGLLRGPGSPRPGLRPRPRRRRDPGSRPWTPLDRRHLQRGDRAGPGPRPRAVKPGDEGDRSSDVDRIGRSRPAPKWAMTPSARAWEASR